MVGSEAQDQRMIGVHDAHIVGDAIILPRFMGNFQAMEEKGYFSVQALIPEDGQHFRVGPGAQAFSPMHFFQ